MSKPLRLALAQFDFALGDVLGNGERIAAMITAARDLHGADLVVFPRAAVSGGPPGALARQPAFVRDCAQALETAARAAVGIVAVVGGGPRAEGGRLYDTIGVLRDGAVSALWRAPAVIAGDVDDAPSVGADAPNHGPCLFEVAGVTAAALTDADLCDAAPLPAAVAGARLLLVPAATAFTRDRNARRDALLARCARRSGAAIATVNLVGGREASVFDGGSALADADGRLHGAARAFHEGWLLADYAPQSGRFTPVAWPLEEATDPDALVWRAIVRGIGDYCSANGFDQVWLGASGGIDSALVLALAVDALGPQRVNAVRLPSRYTSALSNMLAQRQCDTLGVRLSTLSIELPFQSFLETLAPLLAGRRVDAGVMAENLQSRSRGVLMMALTNAFGGLLLTTGNKSEYAVGYATIYGDMCGGYAPIKDVYKTEVFGLARWRNRQGDGELIPAAVIVRPPSAELRENQYDQDSLPPYDVLDAILSRHIEQRQSCAQIVAAGFDAAVVERVLGLLRNSEWKRRQAAPGPALSSHAFGQRGFPIGHRYRG